MLLFFFKLLDFKARWKKSVFFLQRFAAALWRGQAGSSEPCPVILTHMSSSAKCPGAERPHQALQSCTGESR